MAILTFSRQPYSPGDSIAQEIAEKLDYKLIDKHIINNKIKDFHFDFSDELHDLSDEKQPGLFKQILKNRLVYNCLLQAILFDEASNGDAVIKGRGGHYIMNQPYVMNIRIIAPFDVRCAALEKEEGLHHDVAQKLLDKQGRERENFIKFLFQKDISEESAFDLIFNHHKLDTDAIISTILNYVKKVDQLQPLNDSDKDLLKRLSMEKRVEATIRKQVADDVNLKVDCERLGNIKISGYISDELERTKAYKLAQACRGVNHVENDLDTVKISV
jgi:cytidylate kinase